MLSEILNRVSTSSTDLIVGCSVLKGYNLDCFTSLLCADDCALNTNNRGEMQQQLDKFQSTRGNFGLAISTKETEFLYQLDPGK